MKSRNKPDIQQVNETRSRKSDSKRSTETVGNGHTRGHEAEHEMTKTGRAHHSRGYYSRNGGYAGYKGL